MSDWHDSDICLFCCDYLDVGLLQFSWELLNSCRNCSTPGPRPDVGHTRGDLRISRSRSLWPCGKTPLAFNSRWCSAALCAGLHRRGFVLPTGACFEEQSGLTIAPLLGWFLSGSQLETTHFRRCLDFSDKIKLIYSQSSYLLFGRGRGFWGGDSHRLSCQSALWQGAVSLGHMSVVKTSEDQYVKGWA